MQRVAVFHQPDLAYNIYELLGFRDRFNFACTNRTLHKLFYTRRIADTVYEIKYKQCVASAFLFANVTKIRVVATNPPLNYLAKFTNLKQIDLREARLTRGNTRDLLTRLPATVQILYVRYEDFGLVNVNIPERLTITNDNGLRRVQLEAAAPQKQQPTLDQAEAINLLEQKLQRYKVACSTPEKLLPVLEKYPSLSNSYTLTCNFDFVDFNDLPGTIVELKKKLLHAFVLSQEQHWVFITQYEIYIKDSKIDPVANNQSHSMLEKMDIRIHQQKYGNKTWDELHLLYGKLEILVTGGLYGVDKEDVSAFLGCSLPSVICSATELMLFTPSRAAQSFSTIRMLRNYRKATSLKPWLFKSKEMSDFGLTTPNQFNMKYDGKLSDNQLETLKTMLPTINTSQDVKLSECKRLLISTIMEYRPGDIISSKDLISIYSGLVHPQIRSINKQTVQKFVA